MASEELKKLARRSTEPCLQTLVLHMHPALIAALEGLAVHEECDLELLVTRLISDGLTLKLKMSELRVLRRVQDEH